MPDQPTPKYSTRWFPHSRERSLKHPELYVECGADPEAGTVMRYVDVGGHPVSFDRHASSHRPVILVEEARPGSWRTALWMSAIKNGERVLTGRIGAMMVGTATRTRTIAKAYHQSRTLGEEVWATDDHGMPVGPSAQEIHDLARADDDGMIPLDIPRRCTALELI